VITARIGIEALKLITENSFDLVITDILIPESDGPTLINGLKKTQPTSRVCRRFLAAFASWIAKSIGRSPKASVPMPPP
jgi:YesN/AraC family two-component response regulator